MTKKQLLAKEEARRKKERERTARRKEYMREYARRNRARLQQASLKHSAKVLRENPEHLMSRERSFTELPNDLPGPPSTPSTELMDKELQEIPETIKKIEAQNKVMVMQLNRLEGIITDLYNYFQRRSAVETPATKLVSTFIKTE